MCGSVISQNSTGSPGVVASARFTKTDQISIKRPTLPRKIWHPSYPKIMSAFSSMILASACSRPLLASPAPKQLLCEKYGSLPLSRYAKKKKKEFQPRLFKHHLHILDYSTASKFGNAATVGSNALPKPLCPIHMSFL